MWLRDVVSILTMLLIIRGALEAVMLGGCFRK